MLFIVQTTLPTELAGVPTSITTFVPAVIVLFGVISYQRIGIDRIPAIDFPIIVVNTTLRGANPDVIDTSVTSIYDFAIIRTEAEKQIFLEAGETWWWESNRKIPINIFLKQDMIPYREYIKTFNSKDIEIVFGPIVNLSELAEKRIKRKSIQLVRNTKKLRG